MKVTVRLKRHEAPYGRFYFRKDPWEAFLCADGLERCAGSRLPEKLTWVMTDREPRKGPYVRLTPKANRTTDGLSRLLPADWNRRTQPIYAWVEW